MENKRKIFIADPKIRALIEMREKAERDEISRTDYHFKRGIAEGIVKGKAEGIELTLTVLNYYFTGKYSIEDIATKCGISIENANSIINAIKAR